MSGFDNGPENGDFVRYIDALVAARVPTPAPPARQPSFDAARPADAASAHAAARPAAQVQAGVVARAALRSGFATARPGIALVVLLIGLALFAGAFIGAAFNGAMAFFGAALVYFAFMQLVAVGKTTLAKLPASAGPPR